MVRGCAKRLLAHLGSPGQRAIKRLLCVCVLIPLLVQENLWDWLTELRFYIPFDVKNVILETFPKPIYWLGIEKLNLTQQKHTFTNQKKCTTEMQKKLKPGLVTSYDIWPGNGEGLFWFRRFINLLLTYLPTYLQSRDPHGSSLHLIPPLVQEKSLGIKGWMSFLSSNQQCCSTEGNTKYRPQP